MIGPNALLLGIFVIIGLIVIVGLFVKYRVQIHLGKLGIMVGSKEANSKLDELLKKLDSIELDVLRLNLILKDNALEERVRCGKRYVEKGGNGPASILYESLAEELRQEIVAGRLHAAQTHVY
jgi:hypothetical protein